MSVVITYINPAGLTGPTPPTAAQMASANNLVAAVSATADGDTTAVITHNWGLSAAQLANYHPFVIISKLTANLAAANLSAWAAAWTDGNTITLTKATTGSSGAAGNQIVVILLKPHSIIDNP